MFLNALGLLILLAGILLIVNIIRKYLRTRDIGLIWLGVAVVIWPLLSHILDRREMVLVNRLLRRESVGFFPFTLVEHGQMAVGTLVESFVLLHRLVGLSLLLVAVFYLHKMNGEAKET